MSCAIMSEDLIDPSFCEEILERGISKSEFKNVAKHVSNIKTFSAIAGVSSRTLARLSDEGKIPSVASEVTVSALRVLMRATEIFGTEDKALDWINAPNRALGKRTPLSMLNTRFGAEEVDNILGRIEYGVYS